MENNVVVIEILKIVQHILWVVSAFWLGYIIGRQKICEEIMKRDMEYLKKKIKKERRDNEI